VDGLETLATRGSEAVDVCSTVDDEIFLGANKRIVSAHGNIVAKSARIGTSPAVVSLLLSLSQTETHLFTSRTSPLIHIGMGT
jgi:hypothetical protein